jgi:hypothetical protein
MLLDPEAVVIICFRALPAPVKPRIIREPTESATAAAGCVEVAAVCIPASALLLLLLLLAETIRFPSAGGVNRTLTAHGLFSAATGGWPAPGMPKRLFAPFFVASLPLKRGTAPAPALLSFVLSLCAIPNCTSWERQYSPWVRP